MPRFHLLQLIWMTALIAVSLVVLQTTKFSDQYYVANSAMFIRTFAFALILAISIAIVLLARIEAGNANIRWAGKLTSASTIASIFVLAIFRDYIVIGDSRRIAFHFLVITCVVLLICSLWFIERRWRIAIFLILGFFVEVEYVCLHFNPYKIDMHTKLHDIAIWVSLVPIGMYLTEFVYSLRPTHRISMNDLLLFAPLLLMNLIALFQQLYDFWWLRL